MTDTGRGTGPDFIEALARGLDVLRSFRPGTPAVTLSELAGRPVSRGPRSGASYHAGGARLCPRRRPWLRADPARARPRHGLCQRAEHVAGGPSAHGAAGRPDQRVDVDGPAGRQRHRLRRAGRRTQDRDARREHRHPLPRPRHLDGQGAAGALPPAALSAALAEPSRSGITARRRPSAAELETPCARYAPRAGPWPTRTWRRASARSPPASATATAGCWPRST